MTSPEKAACRRGAEGDPVCALNILPRIAALGLQENSGLVSRASSAVCRACEVTLALLPKPRPFMSRWEGQELGTPSLVLLASCLSTFQFRLHTGSPENFIYHLLLPCSWNLDSPHSTHNPAPPPQLTLETLLQLPVLTAPSPGRNFLPTQDKWPLSKDTDFATLLLPPSLGCSLLPLLI